MKQLKRTGGVCGLFVALLLGAMSTQASASTISVSVESTKQNTGLDLRLEKLLAAKQAAWDASWKDNHNDESTQPEKKDLPSIVLELQKLHDHSWVDAMRDDHFDKKDFDHSWKSHRAHGYDKDDCVTAVPVPGAAWLLFSAIAGLGGIQSSRARKQALIE